MNELIYCDKCGKPVNTDDQNEYDLCPECAERLYQKLFGNQ